jgi:hypothetical protein
VIITSNPGFAKPGEIFGDPVVATVLIDWFLHHAVVIQIEGSSYRLRQHRASPRAHPRQGPHRPPLPAPPPGRRGRPPKTRDATRAST